MLQLYHIQFVILMKKTKKAFLKIQGSAELNSYVLVEPKPVEGYTANSGSSQKILTHSGQIFEVEYTKKPTWSFTIRYIDIETQQPIIKDSVQSVPDTTSQVVVQSPSVKEQSALEGYMIVSDPQMTVTRDQDGETVVFYYTKHSQALQFSIFYIW